MFPRPASDRFTKTWPTRRPAASQIANVAASPSSQRFRFSSSSSSADSVGGRMTGSHRDRECLVRSQEGHALPAVSVTASSLFCAIGFRSSLSSSSSATSSRYTDAAPRPPVPAANGRKRCAQPIVSMRPNVPPRVPPPSTVSDLCERYAEHQGFRFPQLLNHHWPGAAGWERIVGDEQLKLQR